MNRLTKAKLYLRDVFRNTIDTLKRWVGQFWPWHRDKVELIEPLEIGEITSEVGVVSVQSMATVMSTTAKASDKKVPNWNDN